MPGVRRWVILDSVRSERVTHEYDAACAFCVVEGGAQDKFGEWAIMTGQVRGEDTSADEPAQKWNPVRKRPRGNCGMRLNAWDAQRRAWTQFWPVRAKGRIRAVAVGLLILLAGPAKACLPTILVWPEGAPLPAIVIEGKVVSESSGGIWDRSIVVSPIKVIRGQWDGEIRAAVSCGASSPAVGELALLVRLKHEDGWEVIPAWQRAEFERFLKEGS